MVVNVFVNALAKVDDGPLLAAVNLSVLVLRSEGSEKSDIVSGRSVLLVDLGRCD